MIAALFTKFAATKAASWLKPVLLILALTLTIGGSIYAGYSYVSGLQSQLITKTAELQAQVSRAEEAEAQINTLKMHLSNTARQMRELEERNQRNENLWDDARERLDHLSTSGVADADDFNRLSRDVNRMLEQATRP